MRFQLPASGTGSLPTTPDRWKKSSSTGSSSSRKWRLRDLMVGRSRSDGKVKFVFLAPPEKKMATASKTGKRGGGGQVEREREGAEEDGGEHGEPAPAVLCQGCRRWHLTAVVPGLQAGLRWIPQTWSDSSTSSSSSRKGRLRDLMVGRSRSDGKEKFVFLAPPEKKMATAETAKQAKEVEAGKSKEKGKGQKKTEANMASLYRLYYVKAAGGGTSRRSSQAYKQGFVGFLGLGRTF